MSNYPANSKKRGVHLCILSLIAISLFSFPATVSAQVTISSLSPVSGAAGTDVTITGTNFSTTAANNIVYFSGVKASVTAATSTSLTVTVPKGATNGPVTVTTAGLTAYSSQFFLPTASQTKQILVQADLSQQSDISLTTRTYGMISGDLNGDGKPDLVVTDNGYTSTLSNTLTVLPNSTATDGGTISFGTATNYTVAGYNSLGIPALGDFDGDGNPDVLINGNDYGTSIGIGRYDALNGLLLKGDGSGGFQPLTMQQSGIYIPSNGRALVKLQDVKGNYLVAASQNKNDLKLYALKRSTGSIPVRPDDVSAVISYRNGRKEKREIYYGSSFLSQSARGIMTGRDVTSVDITNSRHETRTVRPGE